MGETYEDFAYENYTKSFLGTFFKRKENGCKEYCPKA